MNKEQQAELGGGELGTFQRALGEAVCQLQAGSLLPLTCPPTAQRGPLPGAASSASHSPPASCGARAAGLLGQTCPCPRGLESRPHTWQSPGGGLLLSGRLNPRCRTCERK